MFSSSIPGRVAPTGREPNLPGDKYNRLTLVGEVPGQTVSPSRRLWNCACDCGTEKNVILTNLRVSHTESCGCLQREVAAKTASEHNRTHGMEGTRSYSIWLNMKQRCTNPNNKDFAYYGGRGITLCSEWRESFERFLADMGEAPTGLTIDRIDNSGNYVPGNCRYVDRKTQARNQRSNRLVGWNGKNICLAEAAEIAGLDYKMVHARLYAYGYSIHQALESTEFGEPLPI